MTKKIVAAVEGGGTTFRLVVGEIDDEGVSTTTTTTLPKIVARTTVDSSHNPQTALQQCVQFLQQHRPAQGYYDGLGLATFGPVGVHPHRPDEYGCILPTTPKPIWRSVNLLQPLLQACSSDNGQQVPKVLVDTDVNAPALSEFLHYNDDTVARNGHAEKITSLAYVTVGTGVGVGLIVNGRPVHGRMHPEGGHVAIQPLEEAQDDSDNTTTPVFAGYSWGPEHCPFGGKHTVEGTACSVALRERLQHRWKQSTMVPADVLSTLPDDDPLWDHAANALANLCVTLLLLVSVERIVLGGGIVMKRQHILLDKIRVRTRELLNGYLPLPDDLSQLIVTPTFGEDAGLTGAMVLAARAVTEGTEEEKKKALGGKNNNERETKLKQVAFGMGLWQGIIVGSLSVALLWKYMGGNRKRSY